VALRKALAEQHGGAPQQEHVPVVHQSVQLQDLGQVEAAAAWVLVLEVRWLQEPGAGCTPVGEWGFWGWGEQEGGGGVQTFWLCWDRQGTSGLTTMILTVTIAMPCRQCSRHRSPKVEQPHSMYCK
jgi:hypothetical protein